MNEKLPEKKTPTYFGQLAIVILRGEMKIKFKLALILCSQTLDFLDNLCSFFYIVLDFELFTNSYLVS